MEINSIKTDKELEENGQTFPFGPDGSLLLARMGNTKYEEYVNKETEKVLKGSIDGELDPMDRSRINREACAKFVILGWDNITEDGKIIKYSYETALRWINDHKDFRDSIALMASYFANYQTQFIKEQAGNS